MRSQLDTASKLHIPWARYRLINLEHNAADPPGVIGVVITPARGQEAPKGLVPSFEEFFEASYASVASALVLLVGGRRSR